MPSGAAWLVVALVGCLSSGCYTGTAAYVRPSVAVARDHAGLRRAVEDTIAERGLRIVSERASPEVIVAVTALDRSSGAATRDRWWFYVEEGGIRVEMHPEMRVARHQWERTMLVCECYRYSRERAMLRAIRARASGRTVPPEQRAALGGSDPGGV